MLPSRALRSISRATIFSAAIAAVGGRTVVLAAHHQTPIHAPATSCTRLPPSAAYFSASARTCPAVTGDASMSSLREHVTPSVLKEALDFWFEHLTDERQFVAPPQTAAMRWFKRDEEFDKACVAKFGPALEAIHSAQGATAEDLLATIDHSAPLEWIGLVLLLDQMPRNTYRGDEAKVAYTVFDPLSQEVVRRAVKEGVFDSPDLRARVAYRCWFLFPFMHSESVELHAECVRMCETLVEDAKKLEDEKEREAATKFAQTFLDFERRHQKIVDRFGRYPHRNKAVGRESTPEEEAYLKEGGETFGG